MNASNIESIRTGVRTSTCHHDLQVVRSSCHVCILVSPSLSGIMFPHMLSTSPNQPSKNDSVVVEHLLLTTTVRARMIEDIPTKVPELRARHQLVIFELRPTSFSTFSNIANQRPHLHKNPTFWILMRWNKPQKLGMQLIIQHDFSSIFPYNMHSATCSIFYYQSWSAGAVLLVWCARLVAIA